jgi:hypothetical protein
MQPRNGKWPKFWNATAIVAGSVIAEHRKFTTAMQAENRPTCSDAS